MRATTHVQSYYDALRSGDPLGEFFVDDPAIAKFGIAEHLDGYDAVMTGLREQTRTTTDWTVDSTALRVIERDSYAWFSDLVDLSWVDTTLDTAYAFETRWSGTLERAADGWGFLGLHVSEATPLDT